MQIIDKDRGIKSDVKVEYPECRIVDQYGTILGEANRLAIDFIRETPSITIMRGKVYSNGTEIGRYKGDMLRIYGRRVNIRLKM